jgi:N-acetylglucosaminyl-diphospho-decaprenol L-rhamnosyltransferase
MKTRFHIAHADRVNRNRVNRLSGPSRTPDVDSVVVNRDGGDALFRALASLERQRDVRLSAVVVDNASRAEERQRIAAEAPSARVIGFSRNLGFAEAANEGIARTRAPFVLLVNNDAVLEPDYAARLAARLASDERLAAAQGLVLTDDGRRIDGAGLAWNARGEAVPVLAGADASAAPRAPFEVSGVSATATLYRREALEAVAPQGAAFDSSFFAYYEDVDLSLRLARAGWRFVCDPRAVARHEGSLTGRRTPWKRAFWTARNRWRTLFRNFAPALLARHLGPLLAADLAHARQVGWLGLALPLLVWPRLPAMALRAREEPGLLDRFPGQSAS